MKFKTLSFLLFSIIISSCTKQGEFTTPQNENTVIVANTILLKNGMFNPTSGITVSGNAELRMKDSGRFILLKDFSVSAGPDLKVYLSKKDTPSDFINLGSFDPQKGIYNIPDGVAATDYDYVLIFCQQYSHLFATAKLN